MKHTVELVELANGAKGLLIDVEDASVMNFDINFRAGDYLSPKNKWDTAHIMEHMVLGANKKFRKSSEFSKEFTKNGAYNNASTGTYHMSYEAECADFEAERVLDMLCLAIEAPLLLATEFKSEKANVREELKSIANNHFSELSLNIGGAMGQKELCASNREKQLDNIELMDIKRHYETTHTSSNMRFIVAGRILQRREAIISRLERIEINKGKGRIALPKENLKTLPKPILKANPTVDNIYYRWDTAIGSLLNDAEQAAAAAYFGTLFATMHSRVFGVARERGLTYHIKQGVYRTRDSHLWWVGGQVLPKNITKLFQLMSRELRAVADGKFTEKEIQEVKQYSLGHFQRNIQTIAQLVGYYYGRFILDDVVDDYEKVSQYIAAISRDQVIDVAQKFLNNTNVWGLGFSGATNEINSERLSAILSRSYGSRE